MNRKINLTIFITFLIYAILAIGSGKVQAASEPEYTTISGGIECFFANGTPITINQKEGGGALITWNRRF